MTMYVSVYMIFDKKVFGQDQCLDCYVLAILHLVSQQRHFIFTIIAITFILYNYYLDSGREQFLNNGGCKQLFIILEKCASLPVSLEYIKFKTVACGCLLNTCCDNGKSLTCCY